MINILYKITRYSILALVFIALNIVPVFSQENTVGLFQYDSTSFDGYTLFSPMGNTTTYLIDNYGRIVHSWPSNYTPGASVYLLEDGDLLRTTTYTSSSGIGGGVQKIAWDGNVIWDFPYNGTNYIQHHDVEPLPNGNVLILAREVKSRTEAIAAGRDTALMSDTMLYVTYLIEVEPTEPAGGNIVWEWHLWDHLIQDFDHGRDNFGVVEEHPELLDINFSGNGSADWIHANSVDYSPELDQIILSSPTLGEFYIIDHSTSTAEAAGHAGGNNNMGGDIIYRWGNPIAYRAGTESDTKLFFQHDPHWIRPGLEGEGNILVFNNGGNRPDGSYSSIDMVIPPVNGNGQYPPPSPGNSFGPTSKAWTYVADPPESFLSRIISGSQRLPNGNTLICSGQKGRFFEIDPQQNIVWEYLSPVVNAGPLNQGDQIPFWGNMVFRCTRYSADYPGLAMHDLRPGSQIEKYPITIAGTFHSPDLPLQSDSVFVTAEITSDNAITMVELSYDIGNGTETVAMYDDGSHHDGSAGDDTYGAAIPPVPILTEVKYYITANDDIGSIVNDPPLAAELTYNYLPEAVEYICGDANADQSVNVSDAVTIINYVFIGGASPVPFQAGDPNCDASINVSDAVYIINYIFINGNEPCDVDGNGIPDC